MMISSLTKANSWHRNRNLERWIASKARLGSHVLIIREDLRLERKSPHSAGTQALTNPVIFWRGLFLNGSGCGDGIWR